MSILLRHQLQVGWEDDLLVDDLAKPFNDSVPLLINLPYELGELSGNYVDSIDKALGDMFTLAASLDLTDCRVPHWSLDSEHRHKTC